jgi:phosphoribosylformylglycinamidine synthase I
LKVGVIVFPGSNCDHDVYYAYKKALQVPTEFVWHKEQNLRSFDIIVLPGGFSYGDYLRCGAIARFSPVMKAVVESAYKGKKVIGICNGFQILTEAGLLPGALLKNDNRKFVCKNVYLKVENRETCFTHLCAADDILKIPIAHGEGSYYCDAETLKKLHDNKQILFRYCDAAGKAEKKFNPNGSVDNIAGIINTAGNVLGMMPHPERNAESVLGTAHGVKILKSLVENYKLN